MGVPFDLSRTHPANTHSPANTYLREGDSTPANTPAIGRPYKGPPNAGCGSAGFEGLGEANLKNSTSSKTQAGQSAKKRGAAKRVRIKADQAFRPREVELMRDLYENEFWSVDQLAEKFETTPARVDSLVKYKTHR